MSPLLLAAMMSKIGIQALSGASLPDPFIANQRSFLHKTEPSYSHFRWSNDARKLFHTHGFGRMPSGRDQSFQPIDLAFITYTFTIHSLADCRQADDNPWLVFDHSHEP